MLRSFKNFTTLYEAGAGMSRILEHMANSDCAIFSAFRKVYSRKENRNRNEHLLYDLKALGYGPISLLGTYEEELIDDGVPTGKFQRVEEESWFVPELFGAEEALNSMLELGKKYEQDSILYIKHPIERQDEEVVEAVLIGTTEGRAIYDQIIPIGNLTLEKIGSIYSQIGKRKFAFVSEGSPEEEKAFESKIRPDGLANAYAKREFLREHNKKYK